VADDTRINWQDYYGLNQGAYQQQAQGLVDAMGAQDAQFRAQARAAAKDQYRRGQMGASGISPLGDAAGDTLMQYGDAVKALQSPSMLQAALEKSGHRPVSALDAAGVNQAGQPAFRQAAGRYDDALAYGNEQGRRGAADYARGQADQARLNQQRADALAAKQRADEAERKRRADWQSALEAQEAGRGALKFTYQGKPAEVDASGAQGRADANNLNRLFSGQMSEGNASDRLRELYHRARNPLARYGVKGSY